jgi:hypothetical protein
MQSIWRFVDQIPLPVLALAALFMALAPFVPEPHLVEKLKMLAHGKLSRPLDIFDLFLHGAPLLLLLVKIVRQLALGKAG